MPEKGEPEFNELGPLKVPRSVRTLLDAEKARDFLIDRGGFWAGTKAQFAFAMDWVTRENDPDRRRVEEVCNLTRDQEHLAPHVQETIGGFVIAYSPSQGGMVLIDPAGDDMPVEHYMHILAGDIARQQQHKTENRRRLPTWKKAGQAAANSGDHELARLCWQAEHEIDKTGFTSDTLHSDYFKVLIARGFKG
jgi:hypothetical protein